jgi:hypothetical protein
MIASGTMVHGTARRRHCNRAAPRSLRSRPIIKGGTTVLGTILIIILILLLIGALPTWGFSRAWGYGPSGLLGLILIIVIILLLTGNL